MAGLKANDSVEYQSLVLAFATDVAYAHTLITLVHSIWKAHSEQGVRKVPCSAEWEKTAKGRSLFLFLVPPRCKMASLPSGLILPPYPMLPLWSSGR